MHRLQSFPSLKRLKFLSPQSQGLVAAYLTHLQARQYAATTVKGPLDALKSFCVLLPAPRQPCLYQDLTATRAADVEAWLLAAHRKSLAPSTINHLLSVMHRFFGFLHERGLVTQPPIHWRRHQVIVPQSLPKPMHEDDLVQLFRVIDRLRDRTMFLLMVRCGLRVGEVSALTWPSINFKAGSIRLDNSKGQVDRVVYCSRDADNALHQWRHTQPFEATYVSPSPLQPGTPLSVRAIQHLMAKYLHAAGITKPYSPHALRHTFATHLLNAGAPWEVVKELMGHRSISMTLRYTQLYDATTRDQYDRAMERLEKHQAFLEGWPMWSSTTAIQRFRAYWQRRNYAAHTLDNYILDLQLFFAAIDTPIHQVSFREIDGFIDHQHHQGLAPTTVNRRLYALRHVFDFLIEQQVVDANPIKPSHVWQRARTLPRALAKEPLEQLFAQIQHPMDRALFLLMLRGGLRVSEVAQLKVCALDWSQQALLVKQGKGRKDRRVYLSADAMASLRACLQQRPSDVPGDMVFWNQKRPSRPLSVKAIHKKIQRYAKASGITASCHSLRHTCASNLLEQGAEIVSIRELLGHASMSSSERYAKLSNQHVKQEYVRTMTKVLQQIKV